MPCRPRRRLPRRGAAAAAVVALALVAAGCATTYGGAAYGGPDAPLRARIASTFEVASWQPTLRFAVSDRAHVAVFQVTSSGYARALYPYHPDAAPRFAAGPHRILSSTLGHSPVLGGRAWSPARARGGGRPAPSGIGHVETSLLMLVASRAPLRLDRLARDVPFRYRGASAFGSHLQGGSAFSTMDRLLDRLVPAGLADDDWAVDWSYATISTPRPRRPLRRIAVRPPGHPPGSDAGGDRPGAFDLDSIPFAPPRLPGELPEVQRTGPESEARVRVPLPGDYDLPRVTPVPDGATDGIDPVDRRGPERAAPDAAELRRPIRSGPSEHYGRLFGHERPDIEAWAPRREGPGRDRHLDRSDRRWRDRLEAWARNPTQHAFPAPPRVRDRVRRGPGPGWRLRDRLRSIERARRRIRRPGGEAPSARDGRDVRPRPSSPAGGSGGESGGGGGSGGREGTGSS